MTTCRVYLPPPAPMLVKHPANGDVRPPRVTVLLAEPTEVRGVYGPHPKGGSDWRIKAGQPGNERKVKLDNRVVTMDLIQALTTAHVTDAYTQAHVLSFDGVDLAQSVRLNKHFDTHDWITSVGFGLRMDSLFWDMDNPCIPGGGSDDKYVNTPESVEHWRTQLERLRPYGFGWYITKRGVHFVLPRAVSLLSWTEYEDCIRTGMNLINSFEWTSFGQRVSVDESCSDVCRFMRLVDVVRGGKRFWSPYVDFASMAPTDLAPTPDHAKMAQARGAKRTSKQAPRATRPDVFVEEFNKELERYMPSVTPVTLASRRPGVGRHQTLLAVSCALAAKGIPLDFIPSIVVEMAHRMGIEASHFADDRAGAERTISMWCMGAKRLNGYGWLYRNAPAVAEAIDDLSLGEIVERLVAVAKLNVHRVSGGEAYQTTEDGIRAGFAVDMLTVIAATCGTGKTDAAVTVAHEASLGMHTAGRKGHAAEGTRRVAYAAPRQKNAVDFQQRAWRRGLHVLRLTSPTSERWGKDDDGPEGEPVCIYHKQIAELAVGGGSITWSICDGRGEKEHACERRLTCRAATNAVDHLGRAVELVKGWHAQWLVVSMTHARLGAAREHAGSNGKIILDERPDSVDIFVLDDERIKETIAALGYFAREYADAMRPALEAVRSWIRTGVAFEKTPNLAAAMLCEIDGHVMAQAPFDTPLESARFEPMQRGGSGRGWDVYPPIMPQHVHVARGSYIHARAIGRASEVLKLVRDVLQEGAPLATCRIVLTQNEERVAHITRTSADVQNVLRRGQGSTVLLDADAAPAMAEIQAATGGYMPALVEVEAADAMAADRCLIVHRGAIKSRATVKGLIVAKGGHLALMRCAAEKAQEYPEIHDIGIIVWKQLGLILRAALGGDVAEEWSRMFTAAGATQRLADLAGEVQPILATFPGASLKPFDVLWYGAVKGEDAWKNKRGLLTIGDPIPSRDALISEEEHLDLPEVIAESLYAIRTRAQLGQSVGRLRTSRRETTCWMAHIGSGLAGEHLIYPGGWEGTRFEVRRVGGEKLQAKVEAGKKGGRPKTVSAMSSEEFEAAWKLVGLSGLMAATGKSRQALANYRSGRGIPEDVAADVRYAVQERESIADATIAGAPPANDVRRVELEPVELPTSTPGNDSKKDAV